MFHKKDLKILIPDKAPYLSRSQMVSAASLISKPEVAAQTKAESPSPIFKLDLEETSANPDNKMPKNCGIGGGHGLLLNSKNKLSQDGPNGAKDKPSEKSTKVFKPWF